MVDQPVDPKAPTRYQGKDSDEESSDDDMGEDEIRAPKKSKDDVVMRVSSTSNQGRTVKDTALGSRQQKSGRINKARGEVVGERQVSFVPESKKKQKQREEEEAAPPPREKRSGARRSASANTFRRM
jgi:ribosome biogenesis protein ENP2